MIYIATTRFTAETLVENRKYLEKMPTDISCIYGSSLRISAKCPLNSMIFVIEMNNTLNQIEGIGIIKNIRICDKYYRIYKGENSEKFNRYIYVGKRWISRDILLKINPNLIAIIEKLLFKGKSHLKRLCGITLLSGGKLFDNWAISETELFRDIRVTCKSAISLESTKKHVTLIHES